MRRTPGGTSPPVQWWRRRQGRAGGVGRRLAAGVSLVVVVFLQDKVLQRLVEQITVDFLGLDRVQQRFVEQDIEAPPRRKSDVGLLAPSLRRDQVCRALSHLETWTLFLRACCCDTLPTCHVTVDGYFGKNFLGIST